jgi:hypothetical protein
MYRPGGRRSFFHKVHNQGFALVCKYSPGALYTGPAHSGGQFLLGVFCPENGFGLSVVFSDTDTHGGFRYS